jgi:hypothetical protein
VSLTLAGAALLDEAESCSVKPTSRCGSRARPQQGQLGRLRIGYLAVLCLPAPVGDLRVTSLGTETAVAALPATDRLASYASVSPAQLGERRLVLLPRSRNPAFHDDVIATWPTAGLMPAYHDATQPDIGHARGLIRVNTPARTATTRMTVSRANHDCQCRRCGLRVLDLA